MKNIKQSIIFQDCMIKFYFTRNSILILGSNFCLVYLLFGTPYSIGNNFFIYLLTLQDVRFLVIGFINELMRNL